MIKYLLRGEKKNDVDHWYPANQEKEESLFVSRSFWLSIQRPSSCSAKPDSVLFTKYGKVHRGEYLCKALKIFHQTLAFRMHSIYDFHFSSTHSFLHRSSQALCWADCWSSSHSRVVLPYQPGYAPSSSGSSIPVISGTELCLRIYRKLCESIV